MNAVGKCVTGMRRKNNEDAIFISNNDRFLKNLYIVADGMGGHNAGEIASNGAIEAFHEYLEINNNQLFPDDDILDIIIGGVQYSNSVIYEKAISTDSLSGMGTTFLVAAIEKNKLYIAHVGDSRLYILRNGELKQMTKDHSFVMEMVKMGKMTIEEAAVHPSRNVITRALGTSSTVDIDTIIEDFDKNDIVLMCSDGLSTMLNSETMKEVLRSGDNLIEKVEKLIESANNSGGLDNISVILITQEVEE